MKKSRNFKINLNIYFRLVAHISEKLKKRVLFLIPLLSVAGILEVASLALLVPLIGLVLQPSSHNTLLEKLGISGYTNTEKLVIVFVTFITLIVLKGIFIFFVSKLTFSTALKIKASLQNQLFEKYLKKQFIDHLQSNSADYLRNITTECHQIEGRLIMPGLTLLGELLPIFFIVAFLIFLNPLGVCIAFLVFTSSGLLITRFTSKYLKTYGKEQIKSDGMQMKLAKESFNSLNEITLYKKEEVLSSIYNYYTNRSARLITNALALAHIPRFVLEVMGLLTISLIAYISFSQGASASEVLIELAVFMGAIVKLLPSVNRIVMNLQSLIHAKPAIENILNELEDLPTTQKEESDYNLSGLETIIFNSLSFHYPGRREPILQNINLKIRRGEILGLKGESGSGKSTFVNLMLGLLDGTEGSLLINDIDIKRCRHSWQNKVSYVPQEVVLFDDTLKNNIVFYQDDIPEERIRMVLKKIKLNQFSNNLDALIGENGSNLSGGQKQRVGIARALVRNPEFIVFDEATSSLDHETECEINKLIKEISKTTTVFIIAHKQSALEICDKVYTIKNGSLL